MTAQGSSSSLWPHLWFMWVDFRVCSFFDSKQLFGPVHHLVSFKGVVIFLESEIPLCLDDLIVTLPYNLANITNPFQLGLPNQSQPLVMLQEAQTFFQNFLWVGLMATSSISKHMRQSPVADSGPGSATLFSESLLKSNLLPLWLASSPLTSTTESLSQSMLLLEASVANLLSGLAAALTGLEGTLMSSDSSCLGLWLATCWMGRVLHQLLMLPSSVPAWALLLLWPSGVLPGEQSCFSNLRPRANAKNGCQLECQLLGCLMQGNWRQSADPTCWAAHGHWGSSVLKFWNGDRSECFIHWVCWSSTRLGSGGEKPWKKPHWIGLTHLRRDLPEGGVHLLSQAGLLVLLSLNHPELLVLMYFLANPTSLRASLHSSWALAWLTSCNFQKVRMKQSSSLVCMLGSLLEWEEMMGTDSGKAGQMMLLFWALPQCHHDDWVNYEPIPLFLLWKDHLSRRMREQSVQTQPGKLELHG